MSVSEKLGIEEKEYELKIGKSFERSSQASYHSIRYDFKPASVDGSQEATLSVGEGNQITVTLPHIQGAGTTLTMYKGNKRPLQKDCVLIINTVTGEMTLEKLSFNIQLKKTRIEGSSKITAQSQRPVTPIEKRKGSPPSAKKELSKSSGTQPSSRVSKAGSSSTNAAPAKKSFSKALDEVLKSSPLAAAAAAGEPSVGIMSSSESSDSDSDDASHNEDDKQSVDSDSDSDGGIKHSQHPVSRNMACAAGNPTGFLSTLSLDLQLSDSGSDSDSDS